MRWAGIVWCGAYRCVLGIGMARGVDMDWVLVLGDGRLMGRALIWVRAGRGVRVSGLGLTRDGEDGRCSSGVGFFGDLV